MFKTAALFAIATSLAVLILSPVPKPTYHSLFISPSLSDNASISHHLRILTRRPHIAGSGANAAAALHVLSAFTSSGVTSSRLVSFKTALSLPVSRTLTLTLTPSPSDPPIEFSLRQVNHGQNPYADEVTPTFHAYAKSGAAAGPVVYANYGRVEDFAALREIGVNVSGSVVLARYGEIFRGDIVRNAHAAGAVGVLVYTDKKDYGGERWFPAERWMPPSGVQVGSVYSGLGDPTTPGWPSTEGCERISEEEIEMGGEVPLIPSLPVSGADGEVILRSVGGHVARDDWQGNEGGLVYRVGPGPGIVNLSYVVSIFVESFAKY